MLSQCHSRQCRNIHDGLDHVFHDTVMNNTDVINTNVHDVTVVSNPDTCRDQYRHQHRFTLCVRSLHLHRTGTGDEAIDLKNISSLSSHLDCIAADTTSTAMHHDLLPHQWHARLQRLAGGKKDEASVELCPWTPTATLLHMQTT